MIVVSGTGRSGTSMWMQALAAAGLPTLGEIFPMDWEERFAEANPRGYFESTLTGGIHSRSNPSPITGTYLAPEQTRELVVKVFLQWIPTSQLVFLDAVLVSVREWRAYAASVDRAQRIFGHDPDVSCPEPHLKWWIEHWAAIEDAALRGYRCRFVSYEAVLADPERMVPGVLDWLEVRCDAEAAIDAIAPALCTQPAGITSAAPRWDGVPTHWTDAFDELYAHVHAGLPLDDAFLARTAALHAELSAELAAAGRGVGFDRWAQRRIRS